MLLHEKFSEAAVTPPAVDDTISHRDTIPRGIAHNTVTMHARTYLFS